MFGVRGGDSFAEGCRLEVVGASGGVLYTRLLDIADPNYLYLCPGISFARVGPAVNIAIIVLAAR